MEQVRTGERRTRDLSWGDARARALMHALAGDAASRTGFRVCAIEVVRPKGLLEFVAIHGDPASAEERLGTASRLSDMQLVFAQGEEHGHFLWIPIENLSEEIRERIDGVIVVPDVPTTGEQGDWHPMDMLVARIDDERGDLRALLYLDVPHDLARPDDARILDISDELATILRSILTVVEREEYADHMRVIRATRRLARSNPARHDVNHLLREARSTLLAALYVDELEIRVFIDQDAGTPDSLGLKMAPEVRRALDEAAARAWTHQRALNVELRDVNDYRRDMVLTLAHELRNPVSVLFSHLELLGLETHSEESSHSLEALDRAARRIEDMVADLMTLASVSDPDRGAPMGEVDLSDLVRETSDFLAPMGARAGVEMQTVVADDLVVTGESAGLQRMVSNLLSNGVKYTPEGGRVAMDVAHRTVDGVDGVLITCTDTGIGISAAEVDKVFTPFFRSSSAEARKRPGTGLGLAIIERVVTGHDGTVEVASVLGEGTTFTVWLPVGGPRAAH